MFSDLPWWLINTVVAVLLLALGGTLALCGAFFMLITGMLLAAGKGKSWPLKTIHMTLGGATLLCLLGAPIYLLLTR